MYYARRIFPALLCAVFAFVLSVAQTAQPPAAPAQAAAPSTQADEWAAGFEGAALDPSKWERFSFEGGNGGTFRVENGQLYMRGLTGARSGVRSKQRFSGERFIAEATLAKVGPALPDSERGGTVAGNAILAVLFDDAGRYRVEWILTSEGTFEAWAIVNGVSERLDNHKLKTRTPNPVLGIVRRGDEFLFMLNGEMGMQKTVKNLPKEFWLMLYGFGSSEVAWTAARVVTVKQN